MRAISFALLILVLACGSAIAGRNRNGALIVHTNDAYSYSATGLCARFETLDSPGDCRSAGTRTDLDPSTPALIWFIASFPQTDNPGVVVIYFGTEHNLAQGSIPEWGFCGPAGSLEIPDAGWPWTGGNSLAFGSPILGDPFFPFYYFNCYGNAGSYFGSGINPTGGYAAFVDDSNPPIMDVVRGFGTVRWGAAGENDCDLPPVLTGACCFPDGSCQETEAGQCFGDYLGDGTDCDPNPCPQPGACCLPNGSCQVLPEESCMAAGGAFQGEGVNCYPNPCVGACCFPDGHCEMRTETSCSGAYQGDGTSCFPNPCPQPPTGACCFEDGHCEVRTEALCSAGGGAYQGDGTVCDPNPCPQPPTGACCFEDGHCEVRTEALCSAGGGAYEGDGTVCDPNPCPQPPTGACCFEDGHCEVLTATLCSAGGGVYQGEGTVCDPNPCPQPAACCFADGTCAFWLEDWCTQNGGAFQGEGTVCDPNPCPQPPTGACCFQDGSCLEMQASQCPDHYLGDGTVCDPNPCQQPAACCFADGTCVFWAEDWCTQNGGAFQGDGTVCDPNPCPQPPTGACCIDNGCTETTQADCSGDYLGDDTVCDPNPCPQLPTGACCFPDGRCEIHTEGYCSVIGGVYQGSDTGCDPNPCPQPPPTGACCLPDGSCSIQTEETCGAIGGVYQGDGTDCIQSPCPMGPCGNQGVAARAPDGPPQLFTPATGLQSLERAPSGVVCWSQEPNLSGWKISSEVIGAFDLESELSSDFLPSMSGYVDRARWWGGYYNYLPGDPCVTRFNLQFLNDAGCVPASVICEWILFGNANETFVGYDGFGWPTYEYNSGTCAPVNADVLYWLTVQAGDHPYPPQWGRQQAIDSQLCDAMFRSEYFGYPNWTPVCDLGVTAPCDVSLELTCNDIPCDPCSEPTSIERRSWGSIKELFRTPR